MICTFLRLYKTLLNMHNYQHRQRQVHQQDMYRDNYKAVYFKRLCFPRVS